MRDESSIAVFEIPSENFILGQVLSEIGDYYAELTQFVPTDKQFIPYLWIDATDLPQVESILQKRAEIRQVTKYDERAGRALYELRLIQPQDDFFTILKEMDCLVNEASGTPDRWKFELFASEPEELTRFQARCKEKSIPIEIRTVLGEGRTAESRSELTQKQREILQLAFDHGYFGNPREITVTELAEEFAISPQAASKRLRRGMENAVRQILRNS